MNLLQLAPDIQEEVLFLPVTEQKLRPIAVLRDWPKQRCVWKHFQS